MKSEIQSDAQPRILNHEMAKTQLQFIRFR